MRIPHSNAFIDLNKDFTAGESAIFMQLSVGKRSSFTGCRTSVLLDLLESHKYATVLLQIYLFLEPLYMYAFNNQPVFSEICLKLGVLGMGE